MGVSHPLRFGNEACFGTFAEQFIIGKDRQIYKEQKGNTRGMTDVPVWWKDLVDELDDDIENGVGKA